MLTIEKWKYKSSKHMDLSTEPLHILNNNRQNWNKMHMNQ